MLVRPVSLVSVFVDVFAFVFVLVFGLFFMVFMGGGIHLILAQFAVLIYRNTIVTCTWKMILIALGGLLCVLCAPLLWSTGDILD